jgi:hypothetical protein
MSESCFAWAEPPLKTGAIIKNQKQTVSKGIWDSNPARVKASKKYDI